MSQKKFFFGFLFIFNSLCSLVTFSFFIISTTTVQTPQNYDKISCFVLNNDFYDSTKDENYCIKVSVRYTCDDATYIRDLNIPNNCEIQSQRGAKKMLNKYYQEDTYVDCYMDEDNNSLVYSNLSYHTKEPTETIILFFFLFFLFLIVSICSLWHYKKHANPNGYTDLNKFVPVA